MNVENVFAELPQSLSAEQLKVLSEGQNVRIERIVSTGQCSAEGFWYDQDEHEWIIVLRGEAILRLQDAAETVRLGPGDYLNIPAHQKHRVEWTTPKEPTVWVAVFYRD